VLQKKKRFNGEFTPPATIKPTYAFMSSTDIFCPIFTQIWKFSTGFHNSPQLSNVMEIRTVGEAVIIADAANKRLCKH
jgi:hypothetical protein